MRYAHCTYNSIYSVLPWYKNLVCKGMEEDTLIQSNISAHIQNSTKPKQLNRHH